MLWLGAYLNPGSHIESNHCFLLRDLLKKQNYHPLGSNQCLGWAGSRSNARLNIKLNWTATILNKHGNNCWTESWNKLMPRWQLPMCKPTHEHSDLEWPKAAFGITLGGLLERMIVSHTYFLWMFQEDNIYIYIRICSKPLVWEGLKKIKQPQSHHFWFINFFGWLHIGSTKISEAYGNHPPVFV